MANKFQKSVLERLEQEATRQKQKAKSEIFEKPINLADMIESGSDMTQIIPQSILEVPPPKYSKRDLKIMPNIGDYLRRDNQRVAKNKTFYLDHDVIEAIKGTARAQNVTDSKLVNDILRRVLGLS